MRGHHTVALPVHLPVKSQQVEMLACQMRAPRAFKVTTRHLLQVWRRAQPRVYIRSGERIIIDGDERDLLGGLHARRSIVQRGLRCGYNADDASGETSDETTNRG